MIHDKDGQIPSPLIMFTCTTLRHALLEWQKNTGVHLRASKSKMNSDRPDHPNYCNYMNDSGMNASCCAASGHKLLTSPAIANTYRFLINPWNTLPESYQLRVYTNTLATVKCQIQQVENPTPVMVISVEAARGDNANHLDYLSSEVALEVPKIGSTEPNIPIDNKWTDEKLHFRMAGGSRDYEDDGDECDQRYAIPSSNWRRRPATELERFDLGTSDVNRYEGEDGHYADAAADEEKEAL
jgi:hypothetical protein